MNQNSKYYYRILFCKKMLKIDVLETSRERLLSDITIKRLYDVLVTFPKKCKNIKQPTF